MGADYWLGVATVPTLALVAVGARTAWAWATQAASIGCAVCPGRPRFGSDGDLGRPAYVLQWLRWNAHSWTRSHRAALANTDGAPPPKHHQVEGVQR